MFEILDDDNSGEMNSQGQTNIGHWFTLFKMNAELFNAMKYLGLKMTQEEVEKMLEEFDDDGSGLIEFGEFMALVNKMVTQKEGVNFLMYGWKFLYELLFIQHEFFCIELGIPGHKFKLHKRSI